MDLAQLLALSTSPTALMGAAALGGSGVLAGLATLAARMVRRSALLRHAADLPTVAPKMNPGIGSPATRNAVTEDALQAIEALPSPFTVATFLDLAKGRHAKLRETVARGGRIDYATWMALPVRQGLVGNARERVRHGLQVSNRAVAVERCGITGAEVLTAARVVRIQVACLTTLTLETRSRRGRVTAEAEARMIDELTFERPLYGAEGSWTLVGMRSRAAEGDLGLETFIVAPAPAPAVEAPKARTLPKPSVFIGDALQAA